MSFAYLALFTGDYLKDTRHLSPQKHGVYLLLLIHCWDTRGPAPLDEQECAGVANCRSVDEIESLRYVLGRYFVRLEDGWYNERMVKEIEKAEVLSTVWSHAGKRGAQARKAIQAKAKPRLNQGQAKAKPRTLSSSSSSSSSLPSTPTELETVESSIVSRSRSAEKTRGTRLPKDWIPPKDWFDWCENEAPQLDSALEYSKFHDHWVSKAGKDAAKIDWFLTWCNWVRRAVEMKR